tara:strand:- start:39 stop:416 length:378 start_codon:yes stop_codon:yes gene_type:complete
MNNEKLEYNEQINTLIPPVKEEVTKERYEGTPYRTSYTRGIMAAKGTLDAKNKDKILENLIRTIFDDILEQNSKNIKSNHNILKLNIQVIENAIKNTKLSNFTFDAGRISSIIEGYATIIKEKNA